MTGNRDPYRLPELLAEIEAVAGLDAALKIAAAKGGTVAYFPASPPADHWLSQLVGHKAALAICAATATGTQGFQALVPMGPNNAQIAKWEKIRQMNTEGASAMQIARATGCHIRTVRRHLDGDAPQADAAVNQLDLFT